VAEPTLYLFDGFNVLHAMGYDAFGLPAEQYAVQTGTHPRITTEQNIANMKYMKNGLDGPVKYDTNLKMNPPLRAASIATATSSRF